MTEVLVFAVGILLEVGNQSVRIQLAQCVLAISSAKV